MGHIDLNYDGVLIGSFLALVLIVFTLLALWLGVSAWFATGERRGYLRRIARSSFGYALASLAGYIMVAAYMKRGGARTGPDIIDWAIVPAMVLFTLACFRLTRRRAGDRFGQPRATSENP